MAGAVEGVREAKSGDRRFTFGHRRYQEALFVDHLAKNPGYIKSSELFSDVRWREYAVTLLQSQSVSVIHDLLTTAVELISEYTHQQKPIEILGEYGGKLGYYNWKNDPGSILIRMLQEGLSRRLSEVPIALSNQIHLFLEPRWREGDIYDRTMVIELAGLLPESVLKDRLGYAISEGPEDMNNRSFRSIVFLKSAPKELIDWVCKRLARETISSQDRVELLRLEALTARLPDSFGGSFVFDRCCRIRKLLSLLWLPLLGANLILFRVNKRTQRNRSGTSAFRMNTFGLVICLQSIMLVIPAHQITKDHPIAAIPLFCALSFYWSLGVVTLWLLMFRSTPCKIEIGYILRWLSSDFSVLVVKKLIALLTLCFATAIAILILIVLIGGSFYLLARIFAPGVDLAIWYGIGSFGIFYGGFTIYLLTGYVKQLWWKYRFKSLVSKNKGHAALSLEAESSNELSFWLGINASKLVPTMAHIRSLMRLLVSLPAYDANHTVFSAPFFQSRCKAIPWPARALKAYRAWFFGKTITKPTPEFKIIFDALCREINRRDSEV